VIVNDVAMDRIIFAIAPNSCSLRRTSRLRKNVNQKHVKVE
jgi:hypothetical protein